MGDETAQSPRSPASPEAEHDEGEEGVRNTEQLWRIEGSLTAVRSEVDRLTTLDDERLRERLADLELRWRAELEAILPTSLVGELHDLLDWTGTGGASASEVRLGLAQLEGWLDGVLSGTGVVVVATPGE